MVKKILFKHCWLIFHVILIVQNIVVRADWCLPLNGSKACGQWAQFSIIKSGEFDRNARVNVSTFDQTVMDTIQGSKEISKFRGHFQCPGYAGLGQRYRQSIVCAGMIASAENRASCIHGSSVPPLCKKTCLNYYESVRSILMDSYLCLKTYVDRESLLQPLLKRCNQYPFNGAEGHCIDGEANEPHSCGYSSKDEICNKCLTNSTSCSTSTAKTKSLPVTTQKHLYLFNATFTSNYTKSSTTIIASSTQIKTLTPTPTTITPHTGQNNTMHIPQNGTESSSNNQLGHMQTYTQVNRILLTAVAITCSLLAITALALCVFCCCSPCPTFSKKQREGSCLTGKRVVIHPFFARREDEVFLNRDDWVDVKIVFDDNWAIGKNLTTGNAGAFPLICTALSKSNRHHAKFDGTIPSRTTSGRLSNKRSVGSKQARSQKKQASLTSDERSAYSKESTSLDPTEPNTLNEKTPISVAHRSTLSEEISETYIVFPGTSSEDLVNYKQTAKAIMITPQQAVYAEESSSL